MNPWWSAKIDNYGRPTMMFPEAFEKRSQDLPSLFCPSGALWIANTIALKKHQTFYIDGFNFFELSWMNAMDIDDSEDFKMAQAISILMSK